jgi:hypothetical protein
MAISQKNIQAVKYNHEEISSNHVHSIVFVIIINVLKRQTIEISHCSNLNGLICDDFTFRFPIASAESLALQRYFNQPISNIYASIKILCVFSFDLVPKHPNIN